VLRRHSGADPESSRFHRFQERRRGAEIDPRLNSRAFERLQWPRRIRPSPLAVFGERRTQRIFNQGAQRALALMRNLLRLLQKRILD
jgi:hypothetical protein